MAPSALEWPARGSDLKQMSLFKDGDVVQVVSYRTAPASDFSKLAQDFYDLPPTPHPFYGMIGFVFETTAEGKIYVFFSKSWADPEPNNMPSWMGAFSAEELAHIGTAVVNVPYEKLRKVRDGFSRLSRSTGMSSTERILKRKTKLSTRSFTEREEAHPLDSQYSISRTCPCRGNEDDI